MEREKRYSKEEIIKKLKEIGAAPQLIKMPAVIERLYGARCNINELEVDPQGSIWYRNNLFETGKNGTAKRFFIDKHRFERGYEVEEASKRDDRIIESYIPYAPNTRDSQKKLFDKNEGSYVTDINEYGIEVKTTNRWGGEYIERYKKDKKGYIFISGSDLDPVILGYFSERAVKENADWSFVNAENEFFGEIGRLTNIGYLLKEYPRTEQWFVEIGFLPEEKKERDEKIIEIMRISQNEFKESLHKKRNILMK